MAADTFTINGREIAVPAPQGFVRITDDMTAVKRVVQLMADPVNDTLAYYISESDVPAAMRGEVPSLDRTFILKVNKELRNMAVGQNNFSQFKEMTRNQNRTMFEEVESQVAEIMKNTSQGMSQAFDMDFAVSVSQVVPLEPHYETENALAFSMYVNYGSAGTENEDEIVAGTATFLNASGVVLFLYGYAPENELQWTRDASMNWAENVMASNSQPPAKSPRGAGFDKDKAMEKGIIGAITGGLAALLIGIIVALKRKKG